MDRTIYQDGVEVQGEDLQNTETTKADAIKKRTVELRQHGAWQLLVTERDVIGNGHVDITGGRGYCANGEQIESNGESNIALVTSAYNFITLIYIETEGTPRPHEQSGDEYNTRVTEGHTVEVLSESSYNALSQVAKDNRVVCGIAKKDGSSLVIQTSRNFDLTPVGTPLDMNGVITGMYSISTPLGEASFEYDTDNKRIRYKAPGDSWGAWQTLTANYLGSDTYKLLSGNTANWVWIEVIYPILPIDDVTVTTTLRDLYYPDMSFEQETSTSSAVDDLHRGIHLLSDEEPKGGPIENNPHGIHSDDLTGGVQADVVRHQDIMHCNGIIDIDWFLNQKDPEQKWNKVNWSDGIFGGDMAVGTKGNLYVQNRGEGHWVIIFDSGKVGTIWQRISMEAWLSSREGAEIAFRVGAATTEQKAFSLWWTCSLTFNFPDEVSADLTWDNVVGRWLFLDVWMKKGNTITWIEAQYDKGEQSTALKPVCTLPDPSYATWTVGGNLNTARVYLAGAGTQTAGLSFGGFTGSRSPVTEEYNGSSWNLGGNLITARLGLAGCGTQNAGLNMGGSTASYPQGTTVTEEYSGTVWTVAGSLNASRNIGAGCGTQNAGLTFGGLYGSQRSLTTEEYNGSAWTVTGGSLNTPRYYLAGCGTQNAGLCFGGNYTTYYAVTEEYNGSAWYCGGALNNARNEVAGCGSQNAGLSFGGSKQDGIEYKYTEEYNGTTWSNSTDLNTAKRDLGGCGTQQDGLAFGGFDLSVYSAITEEYTSASIGTPTVTISPLGEARYVIKGVIFEEVDEVFPWTYTFTNNGLFYIVLGGDKKFHIFENSYDAENYIPIVSIGYGASKPILWIKYTDLSQFIMSVTASEGSSPGDETFTVSNVGAGSLEYYVSDDSAWITCSPTSGTQEGSPADTITVSFSTDNLSAGTYTGLIHVEGAGLNVLNTPQSIEVQLIITSGPPPP